MVTRLCIPAEGNEANGQDPGRSRIEALLSWISSKHGASDVLEKATKQLKFDRELLERVLTENLDAEVRKMRFHLNLCARVELRPLTLAGQTIGYKKRLKSSAVLMQDEELREVQWAQLSRGDFEILFLKLAEQVGSLQPRVGELRFVFRRTTL